MSDRLTSRVFVAWRALYERLESVSSIMGHVPIIWGDVPADPPREAIFLPGRIDEQSSEWATFGRAGRDEQILLALRHQVIVPGMDGQALLDRLEAVAEAIQSALRDEATGQPIPLGFPGEVDVCAITRVDPFIMPADEGWIGRTDLVVAVRARI
jgi:hypothetical protein